MAIFKVSLKRWPIVGSLVPALLQPPIFAQPVGSSAGQARSLGQDLLERRRGEAPFAPGEEKPAFELPPVSPAEKPSLSSGLRVFVRKIRLQGNTVFPTATLEQVTAAYENRSLTTDELQRLRQDLTRYYVDRGYINSGAVIPDQDVEGGIIDILIVEGRLERLDIEGNEHLREGYLRSRIERGTEAPLNRESVQESLQLLLENPLVERITGELGPGSRPGLAVLKTVVREATPYQLGAIFDNQLAPSLGEFQGTVYAGHRNVTGYGDAFSAQGRFADGLTGYGFDYWLPVGPYDTALHAWYSHYSSDIVEAPFNTIDINNKSESYGLTLSHPFYRKPGQTFSGSMTLEKRTSRSFLLGQPFSFAPGVQNGKSDITALRIGQEWVSRSLDQVFAVRSTFNIGLDAFGATINPSGPDGRFFTWLGQLQWARRFGLTQLIWRADVQLSNDPLLPLEKFQIGGVNSVRGYRENQLVRDYGFSTGLEFRYPLFGEFFGEGKLFVAPFADIGGIWNVDDPTHYSKSILASVGLGVIYDPDPRFHTHLYWGHALVDVHNPNESIQDRGIHFKLAVQMF